MEPLVNLFQQAVQNGWLLCSGHTGGGKSSFLNLLTGTNNFPVSQYERGTTEVRASDRVIDTPGFENDEDFDSQAVISLVETLRQHVQHITGVSYVLPYNTNRLEPHTKVLRFLQNFFGENLRDRMCIVLTHYNGQQDFHNPNGRKDSLDRFFTRILGHTVPIFCISNYPTLDLNNRNAIEFPLFFGWLRGLAPLPTRRIVLRHTQPQQHTYDRAGSYRFTAEDNIVIEAVVVGGGGGGGHGVAYGPNGSGGGGGGGAKKRFKLLRGQTIEILVGNGGACGKKGEGSGIKRVSNGAYVVYADGGGAGSVGGCGGEGGMGQGDDIWIGESGEDAAEFQYNIRPYRGRGGKGGGPHGGPGGDIDESGSHYGGGGGAGQHNCGGTPGGKGYSGYVTFSLVPDV
eukprot:TRINITY_DN3101_c1_g1_i1.p1 TRINITY_DN3101_c1_g1~~TRINITY_DN3101_c1_g1_i1.p1  ORF type:complete len:400 (+),score=44.41 TRINITY_DN3101_c1_g1_i1:83-1282(+)